MELGSADVYLFPLASSECPCRPRSSEARLLSVQASRHATSWTRRGKTCSRGLHLQRLTRDISDTRAGYRKGRCRPSVSTCQYRFKIQTQPQRADAPAPRALRGGQWLLGSPQRAEIRPFPRLPPRAPATAARLLKPEPRAPLSRAF